jgi:hypothetical protein
MSTKFRTAVGQTMKTPRRLSPLALALMICLAPVHPAEAQFKLPPVITSACLILPTAR